MKKNVLSLILVFLVACASTSTPNWFNNIPVKDGILVAHGTATSPKMQQAINQAKLQGRAEIGNIIESSVSGIMENAFDEQRDKVKIDQYKEYLLQELDAMLNYSQIIKQEIKKEKGDFVAYVRIELDQGAADERLLKQIEADKELYEELKANDMIKNMQKRIEDYRKRKSAN